MKFYLTDYNEMIAVRASMEGDDGLHGDFTEYISPGESFYKISYDVLLKYSPGTIEISDEGELVQNQAPKQVAKERKKNRIWTFYPDADPDNADWTKQTWDLPPYKSKEFMSSFPDLELFRKLPVYKFAVKKGLIVEDEWVEGKRMDEINEKLKAYGDSDTVKKMAEGFGGGKCSPEVNAFYLKDKNYFGFLLGSLYNQQMPAEVVWEIPYNLYLKLGHLNPELISQMSDDEVLSKFKELPRKPRYPSKMAKQTVEVAKKVLLDYDGKVENMWADTPTCSQIKKRLEAFQGIGQKKASMATDILLKRYKIPLRDRSGIDIAADILVMRVFKRCGFVKYEDKDSVISKARQLNPSYPGEIDYSCWIIGRDYCFKTNPDCENCPIGNCCPKLI